MLGGGRGCNIHGIWLRRKAPKCMTNVGNRKRTLLREMFCLSACGDLNITRGMHASTWQKMDVMVSPLDPDALCSNISTSLAYPIRKISIPRCDLASIQHPSHQACSSTPPSTPTSPSARSRSAPATQPSSASP